MVNLKKKKKMIPHIFVLSKWKGGVSIHYDDEDRKGSRFQGGGSWRSEGWFWAY